MFQRSMRSDEGFQLLRGRKTGIVPADSHLDGADGVASSGSIDKRGPFQ